MPTVGVGFLECETQPSSAPSVVTCEEPNRVHFQPVFARPRRLSLPPAQRWLGMDATWTYFESEDGDLLVVSEQRTLRLRRGRPRPVGGVFVFVPDVVAEGDGFVAIFPEPGFSELVRFAADGTRVHARRLARAATLAIGPAGVRAFQVDDDAVVTALDADETRAPIVLSLGAAPWSARVCDEEPTHAWRWRIGSAAVDLGDPDYPAVLGSIVVAVGETEACVVETVEAEAGALRMQHGRLVGRVEDGGMWKVSCVFRPPSPIPEGLVF